MCIFKCSGAEHYSFFGTNSEKKGIQGEREAKPEGNQPDLKQPSGPLPLIRAQTLTGKRQSLVTGCPLVLQACPSHTSNRGQQLCPNTESSLLSNIMRFFVIFQIHRWWPCAIRSKGCTRLLDKTNVKFCIKAYLSFTRRQGFAGQHASQISWDLANTK